MTANYQMEQFMAGERSGYQLQFHASLRHDFGDYESLARLFQSRLVLAPTLQQLPSGIEQFVGRHAKIDEAIALFNQANLSGKNQPTILVIAGRSGVGKSTLAIHIAQQVRETFADAQLYINLRGNDNPPLMLTDVLSRFLRAWGISDASMPASLEERSLLLQLFLAKKRSLLLLDNVEDESQVRALLPTEGTCAVLITSRKRLTHLPDVNLLDLAEMSELAALELLQKFAPAQSIQSEPELGMSAVNLCSRLPLAICTFGNLLKRSPERSLQEAVERLSQERSRLKQLRLSHPDIRASFSLAYQRLDPVSARLLRLLGLLVDTSFTVTLAAVLLESELNTAREALQQLVHLRLLEAVSGDRFRFVHDLIRLLARGQLAGEESSEARQAARLRICQWYQETTGAMNLGLEADICTEIATVLSRRNRQSPVVLESQILTGTLEWFETERLNLLAATNWAHQAEAWERVISLSENLVMFYDIRMHWADWEQTHRLALDAARQLGDHSQQASVLNSLGNLYLRQRQWHKAKEHYEQSLALGSILPDFLNEAKTLANLGVFHLQQSQPEQTAALWHMALAKVSLNSPEHKRLKQWMQTIDKSLMQQAIRHGDDRAASRGLFQSIGESLKRFMGN
ncbi:MAG: tetratricopeptide repeat protein [Leptolyngbyaceae cyanobacterium CRU_2_3]|nr:tetratricopeptide repeat protein [Leptolyngbyaceae cyanobacterium CRU_2_3]